MKYMKNTSSLREEGWRNRGRRVRGWGEKGRTKGKRERGQGGREKLRD